MIVNELIKELEKYPWNAEVVFNVYDGYDDKYYLQRVVSVEPTKRGDVLLQTEDQEE